MVDEIGSIGQNNGVMPSENRRSLRYQTLAKARIEGGAEGEILLKDLSITGCCVECTMYIDIKPNTQYKIEVTPETSAKIGNFELLGESKWVRTSGYSCEIGFAILESPKGRAFQRYVDYLNWRSSMGTGSSAAV
ncbi:PilZ domain-containing protein [Leadbettera azotonutricia]|uniref:Type IV pilus assembly protein PilZ n=1 Tax=Leadbettera azotonutricia (strain ATCC BAA-888 / DSM 13862 / ZAS-9) TaxID=545695 RepID=F5YBY5_LEAAZ|nr:PilZ domain-containing protein [Leadbettera azotonutricia]AEF83501.1 type IV pilus assembly protein PilZ [Leadbettera azotonutricia ZAS-9]